MAEVLRQREPLRQIGRKMPKCCVCKKQFQRTRAFQPACSVECAIEDAKRKQIRRAVSPYITKKSKPNGSLSHQHELTKQVVNRYVRWRDRHQPCVTCGKPPEKAGKFLRGSGIDAGHYLHASTHGAIRYDIRQIHAQCVSCNQYNSGKRHEYRLFMLEKHGIELVEWFESQTQVVKWDVDEVKEIRRRYRKLLREEQSQCCVLGEAINRRD